MQASLSGVATVAALRMIEPTLAGHRIFVNGHTNIGIGGGEFYYDSTDTTTADDGGWTIVTAGGARWKRYRPTGIYLDDFGLLPEGEIDGPLTRAVATAALNRISTVWVPASKTGWYTIAGGLTFAIPAFDLHIRGADDSTGLYTTRLIHSSNNTAITFTSAGDLFNCASISGFRVIGNKSTSAIFVEFQDAWGCSMSNMYASGYTTSPGWIRLHNRTRWTEGFMLNNIQSRGNLRMMTLKRSYVTGGTSSFMGMKWRNVWHQFGVGNSYILNISAPDAASAVGVYNADLEFGGWFEAGGGHRCIRVAENGSFVDSKIKSKLDGYGGLISGSDLYTVAQESTGVVDISAEMYNQQGLAADVSATATGGLLGGFKHALACDSLYATANGRNLVHVRGATFRWQQSGTSDKTLTIINLPCFSSFTATLSVFGTNSEFSETYKINTHGYNNLARVTPTAGSNQSSNFKLRVLGGGTGGNYSVGNGGRIDWLHLSATQDVNIHSATLTITMD